MKFYTLNQIPKDEKAVICRYSALTEGIAMSCFIIVGTGCYYLGHSGGINTMLFGSKLMIPPFLTYILAGICAIFFYFSMISFKKRLRPQNWLAYITADGIIIKYRSIMNDHFPIKDLVAVKIPYGQMTWVRRCRETIIIDRGSESEKAIVNYLEINIRQGVDLSTLTEQLYMERQKEAPPGVGRVKIKTLHYPVQVQKSNLIRIEWAVIPKIQKAIDILKYHVSVEQERKIENL